MALIEKEIIVQSVWTIPGEVEQRVGCRLDGSCRSAQTKQRGAKAFEHCEGDNLLCGAIAEFAGEHDVDEFLTGRSSTAEVSVDANFSTWIRLGFSGRFVQRHPPRLHNGC